MKQKEILCVVPKPNIFKASLLSHKPFGKHEEPICLVLDLEIMGISTTM